MCMISNSFLISKWYQKVSYITTINSISVQPIINKMPPYFPSNQLFWMEVYWYTRRYTFVIIKSSVIKINDKINLMRKSVNFYCIQISIQGVCTLQSHVWSAPTNSNQSQSPPTSYSHLQVAPTISKQPQSTPTSPNQPQPPPVTSN